MLSESNHLESESELCRCNGGTTDLGCDEIVAVKPVSRRQMRALAFHYIYAIDRSDYTESVTDVAARFSEAFGFEVADQTFALALAQGVIDNRERYGKVIEPFLENWRLDRIGCCTRLIIYMTLWEFERSGAVASIVINEAVELAKAFSERDAYRFVNGVLDQAKLLYPATQLSQAQSEEALSSEKSSSIDKASASESEESTTED